MRHLRTTIDSRRRDASPAWCGRPLSRTLPASGTARPAEHGQVRGASTLEGHRPAGVEPARGQVQRTAVRDAARRDLQDERAVVLAERLAAERLPGAAAPGADVDALEGRHRGAGDAAHVAGAAG